MRKPPVHDIGLVSVNQDLLWRAGENWKRRWEEAMLRRASQIPAIARGGARVLTQFSD